MHTAVLIHNYFKHVHSYVQMQDISESLKVWNFVEDVLHLYTAVHMLFKL